MRREMEGAWNGSWAHRAEPERDEEQLSAWQGRSAWQPDKGLRSRRKNKAGREKSLQIIYGIWPWEEPSRSGEAKLGWGEVCQGFKGGKACLEQAMRVST